MKRRLPTKGEGERISVRVVVKYVLLQIPGLVLFSLLLFGAGTWLGLPSWLAWSLLGLWAAKDAALFPFVWRSYDPDRPSLTYSVVGERGVVVESLSPSGHVRVMGERWKAEILPGEVFAGEGEAVRVVGKQGLTLQVRRDGPEGLQPASGMGTPEKRPTS